MVSAGRGTNKRDNGEASDLSAVKTLRKALTILDAVAEAERSLSVAEVAVRAGVTRPTAHRLIQTLVGAGYLAPDPRDGRVGPGFSVLRLAGDLLDSSPLRLESLPYLEALARASGERANLGILHDNRVLLLAGVEKPSFPTLYSRIGRTGPAHCLALGKAILAHLPEGELKSFLESEPLVPRTEQSITDKEALLAELEQVRQDGLAIEREEHAPGTFGIAAPILVGGRPVAALGLTGRALDTLMANSAAVQHNAEVVSHVLGRGT